MLQLEPRHYQIIQLIFSKYPYKYYIYGSRAKGTARRLSDLDLCYLEEIPDALALQIEEEFKASDLPFLAELELGVGGLPVLKRIKLKINAVVVHLSGNANHEPKVGNSLIQLTKDTNIVAISEAAGNADVAQLGGQNVTGAGRVLFEVPTKDVRGIVNDTVATSLKLPDGINGIAWSKGNIKLYLGNQITFEKIIINVEDVVDTQPFKLSNDNAANDLSKWKKKLSVLEITLQEELGFTTLDEVLKANANGFTIRKRKDGVNESTTDETIGSKTGGTAIKKVLSGKKYRGFDIIDSNQVEKNAGERGAISHNTPTLLSTRTNVNEVLFKKAFKPSIDGRYKKDDIDTFRQVFYDTSKSNKEDFRGFSVAYANNLTPVAPATNDKDATDATYNTKNIMNKGEIIKGRLDGKKIAGSDTATDYKNNNLQFTKCIYDVVGSTANKTAAVNNFFATDFDTAIAVGTTDDERGEVFAAYTSMKNFLTLYDVDYSTYDDSKKTELLSTYKQLEEFRDATSEITAAIGKTAPTKAPETNVTETEINAARDGLTLTSKDDDFKNKLKAIFDDTANQTELKNHPKTFLDDLVELVKLIDKAYTDGDNLEKSKLEVYSKAADGETALGLAKKTGDETPAQKLEKAQIALKGVIAEVLGKADADNEVYNKITKDKNEDITFIKEVTEIIKKAQAFLLKSKADARTGLKAFTDELKGKEASVTAIDTNLKVNGVGYITHAKNHGAKLNVELTTAIEKAKLDKVTSRNDAKTKTDAFKLTDDYEALDPSALVEKTQQEAKDLVPILQELLKKPDIKSTFTTKDDYEKLKGNFEKMEGFKKSSEYGKLLPEDKTAFDGLLTEVKAQVDELAKTHGTTTNTDTNGDKPFFKTPLGIMVIIVGVIAVLGGIA
ncbi:16643_t:CDS:10 [Funneliformis geosporum]|uniref:16643_t:CDS:1 n=1 Tax=Funneliformis geosporum TaxID=1117311 RepID=A0A9W4WLJ3_9GLOM|nr:16643_t:CDS:10 [Funneliformis geosporum]